MARPGLMNRFRNLERQGKKSLHLAAIADMIDVAADVVALGEEKASFDLTPATVPQATYTQAEVDDLVAKALAAQREHAARAKRNRAKKAKRAARA